MRSWLREIRISKGLTTYQAAELAGISQSYYASIEMGTRGDKLPQPTAAKIANAFGFDWTKFYENNDESEAKRNVS